MISLAKHEAVSIPCEKGIETVFLLHGYDF